MKLTQELGTWTEKGGGIRTSVLKGPIMQTNMARQKSSIKNNLLSNIHGV